MPKFDHIRERYTFHADIDESGEITTVVSTALHQKSPRTEVLTRFPSDMYLSVDSTSANAEHLLGLHQPRAFDRPRPLGTVGPAWIEGAMCRDLG